MVVYLCFKLVHNLNAWYEKIESDYNKKENTHYKQLYKLKNTKIFDIKEK